MGNLLVDRLNETLFTITKKSHSLNLSPVKRPRKISIELRTRAKTGEAEASRGTGGRIHTGRKSERLGHFRLLSTHDDVVLSESLTGPRPISAASRMKEKIRTYIRLADVNGCVQSVSDWVGWGGRSPGMMMPAFCKFESRLGWRCQASSVITVIGGRENPNRARVDIFFEDDKSICCNARDNGEERDGSCQSCTFDGHAEYERECM